VVAAGEMQGAGGVHRAAAGRKGAGDRFAFMDVARCQEVSNVVVAEPADVFAVSAVRTPDFMVDLDVHSLNILDLKTLPVETAWGRVPTPAF